MTTVLLVEDDPLNARVFATILRKRGGYTVIHSQDVDEILQLVNGGGINVVLMDVSLSQSHYQGQAVDGIRITQLLKADPTSQAIPVILVTAHAMQGDREAFLAESGAEGYIAKPIIDQQGLINQIAALL